jgi:hypothetical protein
MYFYYILYIRVYYILLFILEDLNLIKYNFLFNYSNNKIHLISK